MQNNEMMPQRARNSPIHSATVRIDQRVLSQWSFRFRRAIFSIESSEAGAASASQTPEHRDQQIDRENPDQDHLPEPQIARAIVISGNVWVARKKFLPIFEDVKSREDNNHKANAEKNAQWQHRFGVGMSYRQQGIHL